MSRADGAIRKRNYKKRVGTFRPFFYIVKRSIWKVRQEMEEEKLRAVYYARCSTEEENQKDALVRQAAEAEEAIRARGWRLVDAYVESRSGTSRKGRWEYNRLYEDLEQNRFDVVVIKSQDRLMRNTRDWYLFADRLNCAGKRLYFIWRTHSIRRKTRF